MRTTQLERTETSIPVGETETSPGDSTGYIVRAKAAFLEGLPFLHANRSAFGRTDGAELKHEHVVFPQSDPNTEGVYTTTADDDQFEVGFTFVNGNPTVEVLFGKSGAIEKHGIFIQGNEPIGDNILGDFPIVTNIMHIMLEREIPIDSNLGQFMVNNLAIYYYQH